MFDWHSIALAVLPKPTGSKWRVEKHLVPHPLDAGLRMSIGLPAGQIADYRLTLPDRCGLHVQDFATHYLVHIDRTDPGCDLIGHLVRDTPGTYLAGAALVGGLLGAVLGRSDKSMLAGALIGAAIGSVAIADDQGKRR